MISYRQIEEDEFDDYIDEFLVGQPPVISDQEFDLLFDNTREALESVGTFSEESQSGADFASSRYVDQIPCVAVTVVEGFPFDSLTDAAKIAQLNAHRPYVIVFDMHPHYIAAFPQSLIGTLAI